MEDQPLQQVQDQPQEQPQGEPLQPVPAEQNEKTIGPRKLSFFILVLKTLAGFAGGIVGTAILLVIFLVTSSILQPVIGAVAEGEAAAGEVSPLFMMVLMAMVFATSVISSLLSTLLLCYTERDRYTQIATTMTQVFVINFVIFAFVLPIYLTTSTARLELTAYAAGLQIILSATASALILELIHETKYALLAVYTTILAILVGVGINFMIYIATGNATILLFAALPIIWSLIGFSQSVITMIYYWMYQTWGIDFLANTTSFGADYGVAYETEEEEEPEKEDVEGSDFLNQ